MSTQANLFAIREAEHGLARRSDPATSKAAAKSVKVGPLEEIVLADLMHHPGSSIEEVVARSGKNHQTLSPRFAPMSRQRGDRPPLIRMTGVKMASTGRKVVAWSVA